MINYTLYANNNKVIICTNFDCVNRWTVHSVSYSFYSAVWAASAIPLMALSVSAFCVSAWPDPYCSLPPDWVSNSAAVKNFQIQFDCRWRRRHRVRWFSWCCFFRWWGSSWRAWAFEVYLDWFEWATARCSWSVLRVVSGTFRRWSRSCRRSTPCLLNRNEFTFDDPWVAASIRDDGHQLLTGLFQLSWAFDGSLLDDGG